MILITWEALRERLFAVLPVDTQQWITRQLKTIADAEAPLQVCEIASAQARRKINALALSIFDDGPDYAAYEIVRLCFILLLFECSPQSQKTLLSALYERADSLEKVGILKHLLLLDPKGDWVDESIHALRTSSKDLFLAMAIGNPYPQHFYPDRAYNNLVLKALFMNIPATGIVGLETRRSEELSRMCLDYADELTAAGRAVPESLAWVVHGSSGVIKSTGAVE